MARLSRYNVANLPYHLVQRGNNRCATFTAEEDYLFYLDCLREAASRSGCAVHAYVLMTNHVHLVVSPDTATGLGRMMQSVGRRYVRHFNTAYGRSGTLWEGRFKAAPLDGEAYLLACCRYVELNPVRAGMVSHPGDYRWSSWHAHALGQPNALLSEHPLYQALGDTPPARREAYRALFRGALPEDLTEAIRHATNAAWPLGNDRFKEDLARLTARRVAPASPGRPRSRPKDDPDQGELPL